MMLYNLRLDGLTQKLLQSSKLPTEEQEQFGLDESMWSGGAIVTYPHTRLSCASGGAYMGSGLSLCSTPALIMTLGSNDWANVIMSIKNSSNNGYRLTFPTENSKTKIVLSKLTGGSATEIASCDSGWLWGTNDKIDLDVLIYSGGILVALFGKVILQSDNIDYRLTDWRIRWTAISGTPMLYIYQLHYLKIHAETMEYRMSLLTKNIWSNCSIYAGYITLPKGYDCIYTGAVFPKEGYAVKIDFQFHITPAGHQSKWGLVSPDKQMGLYLQWESGVFYIKTIGGVTLASGGSSLRTATSILQMNVNNCGHIYGVCGSTTLDTTLLDYHIDNVILHFKDLSNTSDIVINKILVSNDDTTYDFTPFTYQAVQSKNITNTKIIIPY